MHVLHFSYWVARIKLISYLFTTLKQCSTNWNGMAEVFFFTQYTVHSKTRFP
jgi:hypothetical protein